MKWLAVVGSRYVTPEMRRDIKRYVTQKVADGYGIVSGVVLALTPMQYGWLWKQELILAV